MTRIPGIRRLFRLAPTARAVQGDVDDELRFHLEVRTADLVASGLTPVEARARAEREFGDVPSARHELAAMSRRRLARERRTESWATFLQDTRFALRALRRRPGFTAVVLLTLALGIGANTAIFTVVHAVLLRPLPYADPDRIVHLWEGKRETSQRISEASYPDFNDWREQNTVFAAIEGYQGTGAIISGRSQPIFARGGRVTSGFFKLLGVSPQLGRDFAVGEDGPGGSRVTILGHGLWMRALQGDPGVVGTTIVLNGAPYTVIGVLPASFEFPLDGQAELWIPIDASSAQRERRGNHWLKVIARLRDGATIQQANANLGAIMQRLEAAYPATNTGRGIQVVPIRDEIVGSVRPLLLILYGTVGLLLLIACANVANLLLARGVARGRELAIRAALGAGRGRLVRQMLTESVLLAFVGAAMGILVARAGVAALVAGIPDAQRRRMPHLDALPVDLTTLGYVMALTLGVALAFGLIPALRASRPRLHDYIKHSGRGSVASVRPRLRDSLVVFELALTCVLLCGAGLLGRSLVTLLAEDPGFRAERVFTAGVRMSTASQSTVPQQRAFYTELLRRVRALPGVERVGLTTKLPLDYGNSSAFVVEGHPTPLAGHEPEASIRTIGGDYFGALGIRVLSGRTITDNDVEGKPLVVVINRALAERVFAGEEPVGKRLTFGSGSGATTWTVAGVVADVPIDRLGEQPRNTLYFPYMQDTDVDFFRVTMRTTADPISAAAELRRVVHDLDPEVPLVQPATMEQLVAESPSVFMRRYPLMLVGAFAVSALALALVGLFGVVSYSVAQRTQELGVRVALGAQRRDIMGLILRRGTGLAGIGVALGLLGAAWLTRFLESLLYGIKPLDGITYGVVALLLGLSAILATLGPARRATRVDPMMALRSE